eukprot:SAG22_NODE_3326_length_1777_cov_3.842074_1_plen_42_part_10
MQPPYTAGCQQPAITAGVVQDTANTGGGGGGQSGAEGNARGR